jgi:hypothetical protein
MQQGAVRVSSLADTEVVTGAYNRTTLRAKARAIGGLWFDWAMVSLSLLFLGGLYLDGWAHHHGKVDDSFFTPWHAFFYSGFLLIALLLIGTLVVNRLRGVVWRQTLPAGYPLALMGVVIFAAGGVGDLIWHHLFGIEQDFEALFSPTHLALVLGLALMVSGPFRAAWQRTGSRPTWSTLGPALLSLLALISAFTFIMMYTHPIVFTIAGARQPEYNSEIGQVAGVLGVAVTAGLLMAPTMLAMRRWTLPSGSLTLVWGVNLIAMTMLNLQHIQQLVQLGVMLVAVMVIDMLRTRTQPSIRNPGGWRVFAFIAPVLYTGAYVVALLLTEGSYWSVHMLSGMVTLAGVTGWLLSYLVIPPRMPGEAIG